MDCNASKEADRIASKKADRHTPNHGGLRYKPTRSHGRTKLSANISRPFPHSRGTIDGDIE